MPVEAFICVYMYVHDANNPKLGETRGKDGKNIFINSTAFLCTYCSSTELIPVLPTARKKPRPLVHSDCDIASEQKALHYLLLGSLISSTCLKDPRGRGIIESTVFHSLCYRLSLRWLNHYFCLRVNFKQKESVIDVFLDLTLNCSITHSVVIIF